MKCKILISGIFVAAMTLSSCGSMSNLDMGRTMSAGAKALQAVTLTNDQVIAYVHQSVEQMDKQNVVAAENDPYTIRLRKVTQGLTSVDGIPLNFKVYKTTDVNAFACADGSVRVYSSLMDVMDDDELLGIIGHEIGHVAKHHSRNAMKTELLTGALRDGIGATGGVVAVLSDSQLGALGESLINAKYSRKQETEADNYGYDFLKAHGKNPWGMVNAFKQLQKMEGGGSSSGSLRQMFSSHPDTAARIKNMTERCEKDKIAPPEK